MQIKTIVMVSFLVAAAALSSGNAHAYTDAEVLDQIDEALSYDDNPRMSRGAFGLAHRMSGYDNDRFARILGEYAMGHLAIENGARSRWAVDSIAKYGTTNSLPFLYSCATNPVCGDCAIRSIIAIEGVTSNSMAVVAAFNSSTNTAPRKKIQVLEAFVDSGGRADASVFERDLSLCYALSFASSYDKYTEWMDSVICRNDQSYRNSKRRLAVLRSEFAAGLDHWEIGFVTNAINELVAYPEADLPD